MRRFTIRGTVYIGVWLLASSSYEYCYNAGQVCQWRRNPAGGRTVPDTSCTKLPTTGKRSSAPSAIGAEAVAQHLKDLAKQPLPPHVAKAVEALGSASSLHLRARIALSSEATANQPLAGIYEYWEKDGKYRMHFGIDAAEAPVSEIAYDGHQYQMVFAKDSLLSLAATDERAVPSGIPNPLFLALQPSRSTPLSAWAVSSVSAIFGRFGAFATPRG